MERRGATPDDRDLSAVARSRPVRQLLDAVWPKLTPEQVLWRLLSDPEYLAAAADGQFTAGEQATLRWARPYRSAKSARWSAADAVLLDELADAVIVAEPSRIVAAEPRGLHRLYVVLTRAVSALHIVHAEPLPAPLHPAP